MADIYIVYAREDQTVAEQLYNVLSERWEAWWDDKIIGRFDRAIEVEIPKGELHCSAFLGLCSKQKYCHG